jgi:GNAT superfamily N-acetyltransferase
VADRESIELRRFYVDRPFHGRGLAVSLMAAAEDAVRELGGKRVWLSVFQRNDRAIAFYSRRGFAHVGNAVFMVGSDAQADCIMVMDLQQKSTGS